jgi:hypothetical protein
MPVTLEVLTMTQLPAHTHASTVRLVLLLILTAAMLAAFFGAISDLESDGFQVPGEPIPAPGAGLDL